MMLESLLQDLSLWGCLWQSTTFIALGLVVGFLLRRRPSRAHQVLLFAMVAAAIVPLMSVVVRHFDLGVFTARAHESLGTAMVGREAIPWAGTDDSTGMVIPSAVSPASIHSRPAEITSARHGISWRAVAVRAWMIATLALLARLILAFMHGAYIVRNAQRSGCEPVQRAVDNVTLNFGLSRGLQVRGSRRIRSPLVWCWSRPSILLVPDACDDPAVDWAGVVSHELAHCKRWDHITGLMAELATCLLPWNPLMWLSKKCLVRFGEQACDDWVIATGQSSEDYAESLLRFRPQRQMAFVPGIVNSKRGLAGRVDRILREGCGNPRTGATWVLAVSSVVACLSVGIAFAQTRPANPQNETQVATETVESTDDAAAPGRSMAQSQGKLRLLMEGSPTVHVRSRLSPDGLKLAYTTGRPGMIIVSDLSSGVERKYEETTLGAALPVWSPDGKRIAFLDSQDGDAPVSILTLESGDVEKTDIQLAFPMGWSKDGRFLLVADIGRKGGSYLVDLKAGKTQVATRYYEFPVFTGSGKLRLSPDGSCVAYSASEDAEESDIFVRPIGSDERIRVTSHKGADWSPLWTANGKHILFMSSRDQGRHHLYSIAFQDGKPLGEPEIVVSDMGDSIILVSCSNSGRLLFSEGDIWTYEIYTTMIDPVSGSVLGDSEQLTNSKTRSGEAVWSPNGRYIAYREHTGIRVMNSDGSDQRIVGSVNIPFARGWLAWHPDNEHVLYPGRESDPENPEKTLDGVYSISVRTHERKLIYHDPEFQGRMAVSPDGKHLAITSGSDQKPQLYVVDYDGQNLRQLMKSDDPITTPIFTPDGKEIIYVPRVLMEQGKPIGKRIMAIPFEGGDSREIYSCKNAQDYVHMLSSAWLPDGRLAFDIRTIGGADGGGGLLHCVISLDGESEPVKLSPQKIGNGFQMSPDGTKAVFHKLKSTPGKLWLMSDFLPNDELAKN